MRVGIGSFGDFVRAGFPEPQNPIWRPQLMVVPNWEGRGVGDFVPAAFPEPMNPIWPGMGAAPNYGQSLEHAAAMGLEHRRALAGIGCGGGCGCDDCGGMGAVSVPTWAASLPAPLNDTWGPLPVVYWGGVALASVFVLPMLFGKRGRR